jgi:hypothetical protein
MEKLQIITCEHSSASNWFLLDNKKEAEASQKRKQKKRAEALLLINNFCDIWLEVIRAFHYLSIALTKNWLTIII